MSLLYDQLAKACNAAGVSVTVAARKAGIAATTVQRWEKGEYAPREKTVQVILDKLGEINASQSTRTEV